MDGAKMTKSILKLSLVGLLFFVVINANAIAMVRGQAIVNNAEGYIDRDYTKGDPPNYSDSSTFNNYVFKHTGAWTGNVDCSGLVSLSADLIRHFAVSGCELIALSDQLTSWSQLQPGDLIMNNSHVKILKIEMLRINELSG
jgi:hypothetical protein